MGATVLVEGLTLFEGLVDGPQQLHLLTLVEAWLEAGRAGRLPGKGYLQPPEEWLNTGQSREMIQFGVHVKCNKVTNAAVGALPEPLVQLLDQLEAGGVFTAAQRPDSCCINVYERGAWLPPHVDSEAFDRPFFTLSLLSAQPAVFGERIDGAAGVWQGELHFEMPKGSVLRLDGFAAGPWKHALPRATSRRVSLTFRKVGAATRDRFRAIRQTAEEAAAARKARRVAAKEARGWRPKAGALCQRSQCGTATYAALAAAAVDVACDVDVAWKWAMASVIKGQREATCDG